MTANEDELPWDDVLTYLAIARAGTLAGAARALGVHHSTVFRRLERLELRVGAELFERDGRRYGPSAVGEAFGQHARRVEEELFALHRAVLGSELMPSGTLRLTTLETLLPWVVPVLESLQASCPDLTVELDATSETRALDRRDADMALRPSEAPPPEALGTRIAPLGWAVYAPCGRRGRRLPLIEYVGPVAGLRGPQAAVALVSEEPITDRLRARTVAAMAEAVGAGLGRGALPCYIGDTNERLRRAGEATVPEGSALWLLRHADLRNSARIRALVDLMRPALEPHVPLFAGKRPRGGRRG